jgi:kumamolisin
VVAAGCSSSKLNSNAQPNARVAGAIDLGSVSPDSTYDFVVALTPQNQNLLHKFFEKQPYTGDTLAGTDYADQFSVSAAEYARVITWLRTHGMTVTRTVKARTSITAHATAAAIESAFGAQLHNFSDAQGKFVASVVGLTISSEVAGSVGGVSGDFDGSAPWFSHMRHAVYPGPAKSGSPHGDVSPGTGFDDSFQASQLEALYNTSALTMPGMGETVVILGAVGVPAMADLSAYFATDKPYGLTAIPAGSYTVDNLGGQPREPDEGEGEENTLDAEMVLAFAPYATVHHVITATNSGALFLDGASHILDTYPGAVAVSVSYGSCERDSASEMPVLNAMLAQAKAAGQTWFFASGDNGTDGCRNGSGNTIASAGWPASSPYAVGVGGTDILATPTTTPLTGEQVWNEFDDGADGEYFGKTFGGGGGGGVSEDQLKPAFQTGVGPGASDGSRDEPDVAALGGSPGVEIFIADPQTGQPAANFVAGTSAATPMWAGMWALIAQAKGFTTLTNGLEKIYALGAADQNLTTGQSFNDVVVGNNGGPGETPTGGYPAMKGYDLATGWGTPNVPAIIANWK